MRDCRRAAFIMSFCEIVLAGVFGPSMYNYMQENAFGTFEPRFVDVSLVLLFWTAQVCTLAFSVSGIRVRFRRLGSTTLGCDMIHMYLCFPLKLVPPYFDSIASWGSPGFPLQSALVWAVQSLFPSYHRCLVPPVADAQLRLIFRSLVIFVRVLRFLGRA